MIVLSQIFLLLVSCLHLYFLYLEMFLWTKPRGLRIFAQSLEKATNSKVLAANQGLYNGFLAAGLIWAAFDPRPEISAQLGEFFFLCIIVAGIYGGLTVNRRIFFIQSLPAIIGLLLILLRNFST